MPPKGSKGKKGKGKALPPTVLEPPQVEPAQKEVDKTTNVKAKKKKTLTTFNKQKKEEIIEFLWQNEILYSKRLEGFKMSIWNMPVAVQSWLNRDHHRSKFPFTNRNLSQHSASVLHARIRTHLHVPVRNKSFTMIVIIVSDHN